MSSARVVVTGMGIVAATGESVAAFAAALAAGTSGIARDDATGLPMAHLPRRPLAERLRARPHLPPSLARLALASAGRAPFAVQVAALAALDAWCDADLVARPVDAERASLVVAGQNVQPRYAFDAYAKFARAPEHLAPSYALHFLDTDHVGIISEILDIHGDGYTAGGASASGNVAIALALRHLRAGVADVCLVVGALADLSPVELHALRAIGALAGRRFDDARACRPFDADHEGFVPGEAAACLVLERDDAARARGVASLAEIAGAAIRLDAHRGAAPSPDGEAAAMRAALADAGVTAGAVDYVNAHGTSTPAGDVAEAASLRAVFGAARPWVNSTKGFTGHALWSAGVVEAVATVVQLAGGFVHPNANLDHPVDDVCRFAGRARIATPLAVAISNSFGFGGINSTVVIRRAGAPASEEHP